MRTDQCGETGSFWGGGWEGRGAVSAGKAGEGRGWPLHSGLPISHPNPGGAGVLRKVATDLFLHPDGRHHGSVKPGGFSSSLCGNPRLPDSPSPTRPSPKGEQGLVGAGACQPVSSQPSGGALKKALAPWTPPLAHSHSIPPSRVHTGLPVKVFLLHHLLHCHLCHLPWRVPWLGRRGTILGDVGSHGGNSSGRNLGIKKCCYLKSRAIVFFHPPGLSGEGMCGILLLFGPHRLCNYSSV